jgi:3-hydroxybutyrate dehydrogenase
VTRTRAAGDSSAVAGKAAIVTGGASGIGRALGIELATRGCRVTLADIDGEAAQRAASEGVSAVHGSGSIDAFALDTRDERAFRSMVDEVA